jgi:hypothetical protein
MLYETKLYRNPNLTILKDGKSVAKADIIITIENDHFEESEMTIDIADMTIYNNEDRLILEMDIEEALEEIDIEDFDNLDTLSI